MFHKMTLRHNKIQYIVANLLDIMEVEYTDLFISPEGLRPDIVKASERKLSKYANLGLG